MESKKEEVKKDSENSPKNMLAATQQVLKGKTYHYVQKGETLSKIASAYSTTVDQLLKWNPKVKNPNLISVGNLISVDGLNVYEEINKENKTFTTTADFINYIAPIAQDLAEKNDIYASVMIAQAAHESAWGKSALATIGNNLSGVKGSYNGNSIVMLTWEEVNGKEVWIQDYFRLYSSYREALQDYVTKIKKGVTYNPEIYKGTWVENTASHLDATEWLTGRYATDSQYGNKLNATIASNNLTRFDTHVNIQDPILDQYYITYGARIDKKNIVIYSEPYGTASDKAIGNTSQYIGEWIEVRQEKVNKAGIWAKMYYENTFIGWVKKSDLFIDPVKTTIKTNYAAKVASSSYNITTEILGSNNIPISQYLNKSVIVTEEKTTTSGDTYAYLTVNGKGIGWINKKALAEETVSKTTNVSYAAEVITKVHSIDSLPYGINGFKKITVSESYFGMKVIVTQEKVTPRGTFAYITINGKGIGWIDVRALREEMASSTKNVHYAAKVITRNHSIDSLPYGTRGFNKLSMSSSYYNTNIIAIREKVTPRGTFVEISQNNKIIGWVDKRALSVETVTSTKVTHYAAKIVTQNNTIDSQPYGISGFKNIARSSAYYNKNVIVTEEKTTPRGTFAYITINGKGLGWIDTKALQEETVLSTKTSHYAAKIVTQNNTIDSQPYGISGFKNIARSSAYYNKNVIVTEEKTTPRGTFAYITINGKGLGWIDTKALQEETILSTKTTHYAAKIVTQNNTIDSQPYGISGFKNIARSSAYYNKKVIVTEEKTTPRGTFVYITINGKGLGWIDTKALQEETILSTKTTHYAAQIVTRNHTIDTLPYGISGFKNISRSSEYYNKNVIVTEEKVTTRGTFAYILINGKGIGWIDKKALDVEELISEKTVNYTAKITTKVHTIDTLPYGLEGFKNVAKSSAYYNKQVRVTKERTTRRGTFCLISFNDRILGWIDKKALTK